jgi:hypothetical protein
MSDSGHVTEFQLNLETKTTENRAKWSSISGRGVHADLIDHQRTGAGVHVHLKEHKRFSCLIYFLLTIVNNLSVFIEELQSFFRCLSFCDETETGCAQSWGEETTSLGDVTRQRAMDTEDQYNDFLIA